MSKTIGYVGAIEVETRGTDRVQFSLTRRDTGADWVERDSKRAWFQMSLEAGADRPAELAKLALLFEAMRERQQIAVDHPQRPNTSIQMEVDDDTWDAEKVRCLRPDIHF